MVSGVDSHVAQQNPLIEASTNIAPVNQTRQGAIFHSGQLVAGKQFQAEVVSSLKDGTYIVRIADIAARMQLPNSPAIGTKLSLTLISTSPRATFLLNPQDGEEGSVPTTTSATLGASVRQLIDDFNQSAKSGSGATGNGGVDLYLQGSSGADDVTAANADPRLIIINPESAESAHATLSTAGRLVNQLIQDAPQNVSNVNVSKVPIVSTPDTNAETMAKALQKSVTASGVFYESHLLQWAEGTMNLTDLMKEPQANFSMTGNNPDQTAASVDDGKSDIESIALPREATPLIQQQLQTLEQQRFVWHGELWPGQMMEWEISHDKQNQQSENQNDQTWQSAVNFELPQLGNVSAQLQLTGTHLRMTVNTKDAATAAILQRHASELAGALENTGTQLDSLLIRNTAEQS